MERLQALRAAARVPGPYVLVGHSLAGLLMRLYASLHPRQAVGLVSVEGATEVIYEGRFLALLSPSSCPVDRTSKSTSQPSPPKMGGPASSSRSGGC